jgi:hypothetical protein
MAGDENEHNSHGVDGFNPVSTRPRTAKTMISQGKQIDDTSIHIAYSVLGGFVVLFGMFSMFIRERVSSWL